MGTFVQITVGQDFDNAEDGWNYYSNYGYYGYDSPDLSYYNSSHRLQYLSYQPNSPLYWTYVLNAEDWGEFFDSPYTEMAVAGILLSSTAFSATYIQKDISYNGPTYTMTKNTQSEIRQSNGKSWHVRRAQARYGTSGVDYISFRNGIYNITPFNTISEVFENPPVLPIVTEFPITYRSTNATHSGPDSASPGDVVSVDYTFADGYGIVNPTTDIYVTNNGVIVPSSYSNGTLTFTMPDPSK